MALETALLVVCAGLVVAFYGALVFLVVSVWGTKNDVTVRIALTVFALAWFWPIAHALIWRRARRARVTPVPERRHPRHDGSHRAAGSTTREIDLAAYERQREATTADDLEAGRRGRTASV